MQFNLKSAFVGTGLLAALAALAILVMPGNSASAAGLPYQAYGSGLTAGHSVEAIVNGATVATATVDAGGNWVLVVSGDSAQPGNTISFRINGAAASQTATFANGGFSPPPGLTLTLAAAATAVPTAVPTVAGLSAGTFSSTPVFSGNGQASVVFGGGSLEQLTQAISLANGKGAWLQDVLGRFHLVPLNVPDFVLQSIRAAFPQGFVTAAVTLIQA